MKSKFYLAAIMGVGLFTQSLPAFCEGTDSTRGGGEVESIGGLHRLRDLVDPSVCENKTGVRMRAENPIIDEILASIAKLDWYFAAGLKYDIDQLEICFTSELIRIPGEDFDSVIRQKPWHYRQAAIRFLESHDVYVNRHIYDLLPQQDQAFLVIHESMHSFVPLDAPQRLESVRAAVKALANVYDGIITDSTQLHFALNRSSVDYPWVSRELVNSREAIEFALSSGQEQSQALLQSSNLNILFDLKDRRSRHLLYGFHQELFYRGPSEIVEKLLRTSPNSMEILDRILNPKNTDEVIESFDPLMLAFYLVDEMTAEFESHILSSQQMTKGPQFFLQMKNKDLVLENTRVIGIHGYDTLGITDFSQSFSNGSIPALAVRPYTWAEKKLIPTNVHGFMRFIARRLRSGTDQDWEMVRSLLIKNSAFYDAFSVKPLLSKVTNISTPVEREKTYLTSALPELVRGFKSVLLESVTETAGTESANKLNQEIDWVRLGLTQ